MWRKRLLPVYEKGLLCVFIWKEEERVCVRKESGEKIV